MKINSTTIKMPSDLTFTLSDYDGETYRNANGTLIRDRIGVKRKLECKWAYLTTAELNTLLNLVTGTFFTVDYVDPLASSNVGTLTQKTFYVGDRKMPVYNYALDLWESLSMNFIER